MSMGPALAQASPRSSSCITLWPSSSLPRFITTSQKSLDSKLPVSAAPSISSLQKGMFATWRTLCKDWRWKRSERGSRLPRARQSLCQSTLVKNCSLTTIRRVVLRVPLQQDQQALKITRQNQSIIMIILTEAPEAAKGKTRRLIRNEKERCDGTENAVFYQAVGDQKRE